MPTLDRQDDVYLLDLGDGENRFDPGWLPQVEALIDGVARSDRPRALVTKATGKFWSYGLDLDYLQEHPAELRPFVARVEKLFARVLTLPLVTVAALQGHTYAAGAMLSLCHDLRVMRADRGFWCLPEATIGLPFTAGMSALIRARLTPQTAHEAMVTARRFGGEEAYVRQIVDQAVAETEVVGTAVALAAAQVAKANPGLGEIKTRMYAPVVAALEQSG